MTTDEVLKVLTLVGFAGIIQAIIAFYISSRRKKLDSKQDLKELRYKAIILLCYAYINFEKEYTNLIINRPDIKSREFLFNELKTEWFNMSLYADDNVIKMMKKYLEGQTQNDYISLVIAMRKDLYGVKTRLSLNDFILLN